MLPAAATARDASQLVFPTDNPAPPGRLAPVSRTSISDQAVAFLRHGLAAGRWQGELPSEAELCRELRVSRATVRKAIEQLVREKRLKPGGRGRRHRILHGRPACAPRGGHLIRILSPYPSDSFTSAHLMMFEGLRTTANSAGYGVEFEYRPKLFKMRGATGFSRLDMLPDTAGWVLMYSTLPIQRWIASRGCPGVVFGTLYPGLELPCLHIDTEASARHAAGLFHARHHRRMVFLLPEFTSLSDRLSGAAFVTEARRLGSHAVIASYKPEVADLRRTLDHLLVMRPRPDAFFSNCPEHSMTVLCHLRQAGLAVPDDVAILCGCDDPFLEHAVPSIARYRFDHAKAGRRIGGMLLDAIQNGTGKCPHLKLLPDFVAGGTSR